MTASFQLPTDGTIYSEAVFSRCRDLIGYQLWSGLQRPRLDAWINNFRTDEERYFAARVLDALIYRSDDQTLALMRQLFSRVVPDYARIHKLPGSLQRIYTSLREAHIDPRVRLVPVIPPGSPPTKSGPVIARHLKRALRFSEQWIIHPDRVASEFGNADAFVFIDDFLGTGEQFSGFLSATGLDAHVSTSTFVYACLAGHSEGIGMLQGSFPQLHISTVECLDDSHAIFHPKAGSFPDEVNSAESARDFYYQLLADRGIHIVGPDRRGFGHLEVVYAFEHSVPDNSLPILWWDGSPQWRRLFDR